MKAIMVMFDSLNRHMLPPYGGGMIHAPNFERLAKHCVVFDRCYAGSLPCMPARRELHTGRLNFLHRSWGPLEPFDDSMPQILSQNGVYTHLVSDHMHYWEDGGGTYHTRYNSWELARGQEADVWKGEVREPEIPVHLGQHWRHEAVNRKYIQTEADQPQAQTFANGLAFIEANHEADNWFLQIETFDPHEPFYTMPHYKTYGNGPGEYDGPLFDWPSYSPVKDEERPYMEQPKREYASLVTMCDHYLGKVLDMMDRYALWDDTMLIVNTDHGFLLGEHDYWAKCCQPFYEEISHTPLFLYDPRHKRSGRSDALVQTIDLAPTLLSYFGVDIPGDMQGLALTSDVLDGANRREAALFGIHGGHINCTDGRYVYMLAPNVDSPLYNYTLMPTHMRGMFSTEELQNAALREPFRFTKNCPVLKTATSMWGTAFDCKTQLFDLQNDPGQQNPLDLPEVEKRMKAHIARLMRENDAPQELYDRYSLQ